MYAKYTYMRARLLSREDQYVKTRYFFFNVVLYRLNYVGTQNFNNIKLASEIYEKVTKL